jgi:L-seryl-tRNA(Ser) seleniumtransferase
MACATHLTPAFLADETAERSDRGDPVLNDSVPNVTRTDHEAESLVLAALAAGQDVYDALGVKRIINAAAPLTVLGGAIMPPPVAEAMAAAAHTFVDFPMLQRRVGDRIAQLTHNEDCVVSCGSAAGIALAVAACIAGEDPELVGLFPYLHTRDDIRDEVIIHRSQRNGFDYAARQTGARLVEIGNTGGTTEKDLEAAICSRTACVLYFVGTHLAAGALPLETVIEIAHAHGVPVVVDAASQTPPIDSLWRYTREYEADLVIISGGKGLRGPQTTGLVLGRRDLIAACRANNNPNTSIGRTMKVGKEELIGILAAVEWSLSDDEAQKLAAWEAIVQRWVSGLESVPGIRIERRYPSTSGQTHARAVVHLEKNHPLTRDQVIASLYDGDPAIAVGRVDDDAFGLNPHAITSEEADIVLQKVRALLL